MHSHPRKSRFAAGFAAALLVAAIGHAAPQSDSPPGDAKAAASQTALAIAGVAAMKPAIGGPAPSPAESPPPGATIVAPESAGGTEPASPASHKMTAEQRQEFMMLLIMRETSRNPFGTLH